LWT
jgi:dipeptidyl aminopeptidase/acylaminoacyl peptidase